MVIKGKHIWGSVALVTVLTLAGKGLGFFREMAVASSFGVSGDYDAFIVANTLPNYTDVIAMTALASFSCRSS